MHGPTMPLVPIMPISGENRCMLPPRPCEQPVARPNSSAISSRGGIPLASAWPWPRCVLKTTSSRRQMGADAGRDRLLADVGVAGAVDQPALVAAGQFLLGLPDELHRAIELAAAARPMCRCDVRSWHAILTSFCSARNVCTACCSMAGRAAGVHRQVAAVHRDDRAGDPRRGIGRQQHGQPLMSSGWPSRPAGMPLQEPVFQRRVVLPCGLSRLGLTTCAGRIALTRTPRWLHSVLSSRVIWTTAPIAML